MTLRAVIDEMIQSFAQSGMEQPQFEARQLIQECLSLSFAQLMSQPERELPAESVKKVKDWQAQRVKGVPLAYLSRHRGFYKYDFIVEPGVLVPRPETEILVETVLRRLDDRPIERPPVEKLADLGSGTGCIGLSLLAELTGVKLWAVDLSKLACEVTQKNADALGLSDRVRIFNFKVEQWQPGEKFDCVVANPPYIAENDSRVQPSVRKYEPHEALFAADDGMESIRSWCAWAHTHLLPKGLFVCEIGADQSRLVQDLFAKQGFESIQVDRDLAGIERVVSGIKAR